VVTSQQHELARLRAQARQALVVERAKGVLIERLGCSPVQAAEHLNQLAERAVLTLPEIAAEVAGGSTTALDDDVPDDPTTRYTVVGEIAGLRLLRTEAAATLAPDGIALADAVFTEALAATGAVAVALWVLQPEGTLRLVGQHGLAAWDVARWRSLPPDMATPGRQALAEARAVWRPAGLRPDEPGVAAARWPDGARAVLPLRHRRASVGVLEVYWPGPVDFAPGLRTQLNGLADLCAATLAPAIDRVDGDDPHGLPGWLVGLLDSLSDTALLARPVRDGDGAVVDFVVDHVSTSDSTLFGPTDDLVAGSTLLRRYPMMSARGGLFDRICDVLATGVPHRADGLLLPILVGDRVVRAVMDLRVIPLLDGVVLTWRNHDEADLAHQALRLSRTGGWAENLVTGQTTWTAQTFDLLAAATPVPLRDWRTRLSPEDLPGLDRFTSTLLSGHAATTVVSTTVGQRRRLRVIGDPVSDMTGSVVAVRGALHELVDQDHVEFTLSAVHHQLTDVERLVDEQQQWAIRLQHAIIAPAPPPVALPGLQVVVRYRPAGNQHLVGGDWYDALTLPSNQVLLVVGDIMGHGIDAVTGMISMRNALRGLAMTGASPAALLRWLNNAAHALPEPVNGTVVCGYYEPTTGVLRWARAGHLPPLLVRGGTAELLPLPTGLMLGAIQDAEYEDTSIQLRPGDVLALFTDGLIERRGEVLDYGLDRLMANAKHMDDDIDRYANRLLDHIPANSSDDTCLVTVRVTDP
jgi:serine phosphatase RsbU (regulator of sigma subunit)